MQLAKVGIHPTYAEFLPQRVDEYCDSDTCDERLCAMRSYTTMTEEKTEGSALPTKGGPCRCRKVCFAPLSLEHNRRLLKLKVPRLVFPGGAGCCFGRALRHGPRASNSSSGREERRVISRSHCHQACADEPW